MASAAELFEQGVSLENEGRDEEAIAAFTEVLEQEPENGQAWYHKAVCLRKLERYQDSMDAVTKAIQFDPRNLDAMKLKFGLAGKAT
jgi:tetratricopeptide (TPR) repeat protein